MPLSLRAREAMVLTTIVLLVVTVTTAAHLASVAQITLGAAADEGRLLTRQLFHQGARAMARAGATSLEPLRDDSGVRALLEGMIGYSRVVVYAAIVDATGRAVVHSDPALEGRAMPPRARLDEILALGSLPMVVGLLRNPQIYDAQLALGAGDRPIGTVRVGVSTSLVRQELTHALMRSLALGAVALVVAIAVGLGAGRVLLRFYRQIALRVERLARSGFGSAVELTRGDEMGELAERVNRLGARIRADPAPPEGRRAWIEGAINRLEDGVIFLNAQREVIFCSEAAERCLGVKLEALLSHPLDTVLPSGHPLLAVERRLFETGEGCRSLRLAMPESPRSGIRAQELAVSCYRLPDGEQAGGAVLLLQDLEPVRAVGSLVTHSQKLAALGRLTSGVAHEVKNPLNAMRIHLELLKTRLSGERVEVMENLDVIAHEIQRLDRVVQGFLRFMRPQEMRLEPVDCNAVLADVVRLTGVEATQSGVEIVLDLAPGRVLVPGDTGLLQQVCTNLVTNAIQAMPKGGTLTVATRTPRRATVEVRVADEGVGIPPEELDKIFHLYYTTKENGSGIGLSVVYRIVQMHDGHIEVESVVGEGTTVILTLPAGPMPVA